jgi:hypothetical protein
MKLTIAHLLLSIRELLSDKYEEAYRWSDATLIRFIYEGIMRLNQVRPESRYVNYKLIDIETPIILDNDEDNIVGSYKEKEFPLDSRWSAPVIHYTCYRAFQLDETDTMNGQRANEHLGYFNTWSQL